ncbi:MAG: bacillithiol biosynthesis cysteine-adding enzyme BshC [Acidobacteria bacterium]|nr:bacillithiol biosynthesis cysteine-adding enzyme BshC [Acidobacteriota bacterium]
MQEIGGTKPVSVREIRIESLPFSSIPSQNKLFLDYLADPVSLGRFYPSAVDRPIDIEGRLEEVLANYHTDRERLCNALVGINSSFQASDATLANIELLRERDTVAILTGQQTGLFTGPLYSIYKALSAIKMAECLRQRGVKAVPVFWMATEDHDLEEVSNAFAIGSGGELVEAKLDEAKNPGKPVGSVHFTDSIIEVAGRFIDALPGTEFTAELKSEIDRQWKPGAGFGSAFGTMLTQLLGKYGLIVVDPLDEAIKGLAAPIYASAIEKSESIVAALTARGNELAATGYAAQVLVEDDYFPLFYQTDDGRRAALRRNPDGSLQVKGERIRFSVEELIAVAENDSSRLSPGVMLRPVVQDYLFPTLCYFGGGAEIAYFAQNSEVYRILGRSVTPILHRQSFTLVEAKHARTLAAYGLEFTDLFAGEAAVLPELVDKFIDPNTARLFGEAEENINAELLRLDQALSDIDITLAANLATRRRKIVYHIGALRKKYQLRRAEKDEIIGRRVRAAFTALLPNGHLQERTLNIISYLDRLGTGFVDTVYDSIDLDDKGHRLIYL